MNQIGNSIKIRKVGAAAVAGTSDVESSIVAVDGIDVLFAASIATVNAGNYMQVEQNDSNSTVGMAALEGSKALALVNGDVVAVEVFRPTKPYLRAVIKRGASTATGDIYCLQSGLPVEPVDNNEASEIVGTAVISPAEGTP